MVLGSVPEARIQVLIKQETPYGNFSDALYFTADEFAALDDTALQAAKQARVDGWVAVVTASAPEPVTPTSDALLEEAVELRTRLESIDAVLTLDKDVKVDVLEATAAEMKAEIEKKESPEGEVTVP